MSESSPPIQKSILAPHSTIIVGLSGGPDSIYLLHQLHRIKDELNITIIAAHLDHEWQESSKFAAQLCQQACNTLQVKLVIKKLSELKFEVKWNGSQEELGRIMRRHFFTTIVQQYQASAIALAHHQQDQQETFFIRLLRGSSLKGLTGIQKQDGLYIRPILDCNKQEILVYLHKHQIAYYIDPTNTSDDYLRNRIRNHVIPALRQADQRFDQNLIATMDQLTQVENFLQHHATQTLSKLSVTESIDLEQFLQLHTVIQQRILLQLMISEQVIFTPSQNLFKEIMRFLEKSVKPTHIIHDSWMVQKNKSHFVIKKINPAIAQGMVILKKSDKTL